MIVNQRATGRALAAPAGIAFGVGVSMLLTLLGAVVTAWLINGETVSETAVGYGAMLTLILASVAGSWIAVALVKRQRIAVSLVTGAVYLLLLIGTTAFFFGGQYQGILPTALIVASGCVASVLVGNMRKGNGISHRHNRRYG